MFLPLFLKNLSPFLSSSALLLSLMKLWSAFILRLTFHLHPWSQFSSSLWRSLWWLVSSLTQQKDMQWMLPNSPVSGGERAERSLWTQVALSPVKEAAQWTVTSLCDCPRLPRGSLRSPRTGCQVYSGRTKKEFPGWQLNFAEGLLGRVSTMKKRHGKSGQGRCFALVHSMVIPGQGSEGFNHISATSLLWGFNQFT